MLMPWEWPENRMIVSVRNRIGLEGYLVGLGVTQEEFFEHYCNRWEGSQREIKIHEISVMPIDQRTYELLEDAYAGQFKVGD